MRHPKVHFYLALLLLISLILAPGLSALGASAVAPKVQDNELVISTLDEQGAISNIQVLTHLRAFGSGTASITEDQNFKVNSVRNLYGKEKLSVKDNKLSVSFNMDDRGYGDVYYLSDLEKSELAEVKMPVSVKVSYYLDGQKLEAAKLAGKSGHLKIVTELENLTGVVKSLDYKNSKGEMVKTEAEIFTPYIVSLSGWEFDNRIFSNVVAPGVSGKSAEGIVVDIQGKSTVSWSVPLIPPAYPAVQYTTLEADAKNMVLPSFKIAVVPVMPATSAQDTLGTVQNSLSQLYGAFDQIEQGVGASDKDASLLFGLTSLKGGLSELSGGIASLGDKVKQLVRGVSNPGFNAATFDAAKGVDAKGNQPGVKEAVQMGKAALDTQVLPAMEGQKQVLTGLEAVMGKPGTDPVQPSASTSLYNDAVFLSGIVGKPGTDPVQPSASTSLYNDTAFLKGVLAKALNGTPYAPAVDDIINKAMVPKIGAGGKIIDEAITPKIGVVGNNLAVLKGGGNLVTSAGPMAFPGSVNTVQQGIKSLSEAMGQTDAGLSRISAGIGPIDANGQAVKVMVDGKPGTVLYALSYFNSSIEGKVLPGLEQLLAGSSKIGAGSGEAKAGISAGLDKMLTAPAIISALKDNAVLADSFLGKPEGAQGTVAYVFQTPRVSMQTTVMSYGVGVIVLVLLILFALGRLPQGNNAVQDRSHKA